MFCPKCGSGNKDDATFCGNCGATMNRSIAAQNASADAKAAVSNAVGSVARAAGNKSKKKLVILGVVIVAIVCLAAAIISTCASNAGALPEGTYSMQIKTSYATNTVTMEISKDRTIVLRTSYKSNSSSSSNSSSNESVTGKYEKVGSKDGNNVYLISDLKLEDGIYATQDDLYTMFGGSGGGALKGIYMVVPSGLAKGDFVGRCGFAQALETNEGSLNLIGGVFEMFGDNEIYKNSLYCNDVDNPVDLMATPVIPDKDTSEIDKYSLATWRKDAPGRYTVLDSSSSSTATTTITIPVQD